MAMTNWVPEEPLESYSARFAEHASFRREDGVLEVQFHTKGDELMWSMEVHRAIGQIFSAIGADPENELVILSGTGKNWIKGADLESYDALQKDPETFRRGNYDQWYLDGTSLQERLLWGIPVPTIGVINGPGFHTEFGLMCDLTIAADDAQFFERHFHLGLVPGDGLFLSYQHILGTKRAAYAALIQKEGIAAQEALALGMVNELRPREELLPRARELAAQIMGQDRVIRRLTTQLVRRPWRRVFTQDFQMHLGHELYGANVMNVVHSDKVSGESNSVD